MKIEFNVSIDTNEHKQIGAELVELLTALKIRVDNLNDDNEEDEE